MSISILVLTLNEEENLLGCLESVQWSDDIVVLDSFSTDRTVDIARAAGARIVQRKLDNWASHQNWALENIDFKYEWVFYIDADERFTPELMIETNEIARKPAGPTVAYYCPRKNMFMGKWIRHAMPPGAVMRFFRPCCIRFERLVNPTPVVEGQYGFLKNYLLHYNFSKGLTEWFDKHNRYSHLEAVEGMRVAASKAVRLTDLVFGDRATRRKALKEFSVRLPFRPALKFLYMYFAKGGFLDGRPGLTYCFLQSIYEYMIVLKMREFDRRGRGLAT